MYAVAGRLDDAVNTARDAIQAARAAGNEEAAQQIQEMLKLYETVQAERRQRAGANKSP